MATQLIQIDKIQDDDWVIIDLPVIEVEIKKQAGKVVQFKLTGEAYPTSEQIEKTVIPASGNIILPLQVYAKNKACLAERLNKGEIGIWLLTHEEIEKYIASEEEINQFSIIAIKTEKFADGRIFSIAARIRNKFRFTHDLRAIGDVLKDQLYFLKRVGFSSYVIREDRSAEEALEALYDFSVPYQGAFDLKEPVWRRKKRK